MIDLRPWLPAGVAGSLALLGIALGLHVDRQPPDLPPLPRPVRLHRSDVAALGSERSAPLFAPTRTTAPATGNSATPPSPPPQLSGIVLGGGKAVALMQSAAGGETKMLHAGDTIDGWTIMGIASRQVEVARDGTQQIIPLEFGGKKAQAEGGPAPIANGPGSTENPSFDGLAAATRLGLPASNIPIGSPLAPPARASRGGP